MWSASWSPFPGFSFWTSPVLPVCPWVFFRHSIVQKQADRSSGQFPMGMSVSVNSFVSVCGPVIDWQTVQSVHCPGLGLAAAHCEDGWYLRAALLQEESLRLVSSSGVWCLWLKQCNLGLGTRWDHSRTLRIEDRNPPTAPVKAFNTSNNQIFVTSTLGRSSRHCTPTSFRPYLLFHLT